MTITVTEQYQDIAGKWRVRLTDGTKTLFLKFNHQPTNAEIKAAGLQAIDNLIASKQARDTDDANRKTLKDAIYNYNSTWTNNQTRTLLEAIIARIKANKGL